MSMVEDKRGPGRPKGYQHSEETKAKMSVKRQARTQPRNTTSGQFVSGRFVNTTSGQFVKVGFVK